MSGVGLSMMKRTCSIVTACFRSLAWGIVALLERPFSSVVYLALIATIADVVGLPASILTIMDHAKGSASHEVTIEAMGPGSSFAITFPDISELEPASGDESQFIGDVQMVLWSTGFLSADPNGVLDADTRDAIRRAEYIVGMEPTGNPTHDLFEKLDYLQRNKDLIEKLQQIFLDRGEMKSEPTGFLDLETKNAIIEAEKKYGLRPDGLPDIRLWNKLMNSLIKEPIDGSKITSSGQSSQRGSS